MKVLVTGGAGYIGSTISSCLLDNGICDNCKSLLLTKDGIDMGLGDDFD